MVAEKVSPVGATGAAPTAALAPIMKTWAKIVRIGGHDFGVRLYIIAGRHVDEDVFDLIVRIDKEDYTTEEHYGTFDARKLDIDIDSDVARDVASALITGALFSRVRGAEVQHADAYYSYYEIDNGVYDMFYIDGAVYVVDPDGRTHGLGTLKDAEDFIPEEFDRVVKEVVRRFIRAVREIVVT